MRRQSWVMVAVAVLLPVVSQAAIIVTPESKNIISNPLTSTEGFFDVFLDVTGTDAPPAIGGFSVAVNRSGGEGQLFFLAPKVTTDILPPGGVQLPRPQLISANFFVPEAEQSANRAVASAFLTTGSAQATDNVGLVRIPFTIPAGARGTVQIQVDPDPFTGTALGDPNAQPVEFTTAVGTITITPIPEPAGLSVLALGGLLALRRRRLA